MLNEQNVVLRVHVLVGVDPWLALLPRSVVPSAIVVPHFLLLYVQNIDIFFFLIIFNDDLL